MTPIGKDLYIKRFSELKIGGPLYQPCEVQVGDVGYIDIHDGFFQKLYNIAKPLRMTSMGVLIPLSLKQPLTHREVGCYPCTLPVVFHTENLA